MSLPVELSPAVPLLIFIVLLALYCVVLVVVQWQDDRRWRRIWSHRGRH